MMNIIILGGGFAGISAAKKLGHALGHRDDIAISLVDRNPHTTMLPSLPDVAGNRVDEKTLIAEIKTLIPKDVTFVQADVHHADIEAKELKLADGQSMPYDYLLFAPGSKTNFYGQDEVYKMCHKMDCYSDALKIRRDATAFIDSHEESNFVISGSGFTGIELAVNLNHLLNQSGKKGKVYLVEMADRILPMLSPKMSDYTKETVERQGIQFLLNSGVTAYDGQDITFKDGTVMQDVFYSWCAGVTNSVPLEGVHQELKDKRIIVDSFLRIPEHPEVFVAGDAAAVQDESGTYIRRAVNFAYTQGKTAADNLIRTIHNDPLKPYKAVDLGWVIPLYVSSIGVAMGVDLKGRFGIAFHYLLCGIKNYNTGNFMHYVGYALKFFFTPNPKKQGG